MAVFAIGVLGESEDDANRDETQHGVQCVQQTPPWIGAGVGEVDSIHQVLETTGKDCEQDNEEFLETDSRHVWIETEELVGEDAELVTT